MRIFTNLALFIMALLWGYKSRAQQYAKNPWSNIERAISLKENLATTQDRLQQIQLQAIREKDYLAYIHASYLNMRICDLKTEDTLYFKNSNFLDSLINDNTLPNEFLGILNLLQTKRLRGFSSYRRFNRNLYKRKELRIDYAALSQNLRDSLTEVHFINAKKLVVRSSFKTEDIIWLSDDPLSFLFKPSLQDIVFAEQIRSTKDFQPFKGKDILHWLALSQNAFINKLSTLDSNHTVQSIPNIYSEWIAIHSANTIGSNEARYFIETLARKYIYSKIYSEPTADSLYEEYLLKISGSPFASVKAHSVYQLCVKWKNLSSLYLTNDSAEPKYQEYANKTLALYDLNRSVLDRFISLKYILDQVMAELTSSLLNFRMEKNNLPGESILTQISFKNVGYIHYRIIKVGFNEKISDTLRIANRTLLAKEYVRQVSMDLSCPLDHNLHRSYFKIDALSPGIYYLLFSDSLFSLTSLNNKFIKFQVTSIAAINHGKRVYVLNRKTGLPFENALVHSGYSKWVKNKPHIDVNLAQYHVNKEGYIIITNSKTEYLDIYFGSDSLRVGYDEGDNNNEEDVYDKDEYDNKLEYFKDKMEVHIFTDRAIYRPGQKVFYKVIFLTRDPDNGNVILLSKENLQGFLNNRLKKWLREEKPKLYIVDPFNRNVDSINISPNNFGSVSGTFIIPKTAATGAWTIDGSDLSNSGNKTEFKVEEYKRPTYEVTIEKPKVELIPGDSFPIVIKVRSFAGASLNNVEINYTITRSGITPEKNGRILNYNEALIDTTVFTDEKGELHLTVADTALSRINFPNDRVWRFSYQIEVDATDETGESFESDARIDISTRPVVIKLPVAGIYARNELPNFMITASDKNAGDISKKILLRIYKIENASGAKSNRKLLVVDQWLFNLDILSAEFPFLQLTKDQKAGNVLIYEKTINTTDFEKIVLPAEMLTAGNYLFEALCEEKGILRGTITKNISIYDPVENKLPGPSFSFDHIKFNTVLPGDSIKLITGNSETSTYSIYYVEYFLRDKNKVLSRGYFDHEEQKPGISSFGIKVPSNAFDRMIVTHNYIINGEAYFQTEQIFVSELTTENPVIAFTHYRNSLSPGSNETFSINIKSKANNVLAEVMTAMYDASLDKIQKHTWKLPNTFGNRYLENNWINNINTDLNEEKSNYDPTLAQTFYSDRSFSWVSPPIEYNYGFYSGGALAGRVAGIQIGATTLYEVVVIAQGIRKNLSASVITLRGNQSLSNFSQPLIVLDGIPFQGDLSKIDPSTITELMVLKDAEAVSIFGSKAANGVLILSTKGPIKLPDATPEPIVKVRKDFNETAFFFPNIYADRNGNYQINFTMPETVTQWNWKLLAHTKLAKFIYAEKKISTSLPLMIQPHMPRLLYQGDRIILKSRISNLDTIIQSGKVICRIEDVVTNQDITSNFIKVKENSFSAEKRSNTVSEFEIKVPVGQLNPIKIIITATSSLFSDGEEHIIPILSPKILMKGSIPFRLSGTDTIIPALKLPDSSEMYGIGMYVQPLPQTAIINALPYLSEFSINCAEQTFNKLFAHATALQLMRSDEDIRRSYLSFSKANPDHDSEKSEPLPQTEQTMPWLSLLKTRAKEHESLAKVLDTLRGITRIKALLEELHKLQNDDGGITWFKSGKSNFYISCYLLGEFGKLTLDLAGIGIKKDEQRKFISELVNYCDKQFLTGENKWMSLPLYYLYSRSYWTKEFPVTPAVLQRQSGVLDSLWKIIEGKNLPAKTLLIIASLRNTGGENSFRSKAMALLNSIQQSAIVDENGIRWKDISDNDGIDNSSEETLALLFEAFEEAGLADMQRGILKWLLAAKTEQHWTSTKATAAVINTITKHKTSDNNYQTLTLSDPAISVTNNLLSGSTFSFHQQKSNASEIKVKKESVGIASGNITWYYFSSLANSNGVVKLDKQLNKFNITSSKFEPLGKDEMLKIGDKIQAIVIVETPKSLRYVYIDDKRGAGLQPIENSSGYQYTNGFSYYKSVRDAGFQFFADYIPAGRSEIVYELVVDAEGSFNNGIASLQCMYRPEISAYTNSMIISSKK